MYKVFDTKEQAEIANQQKTNSMGCRGETKYWWPAINHSDGRCALVVDEADFTDLKNKEEMEKDGWFHEPEGL